MNLATKEEPSWGGSYYRKNSQSEATNKYHSQEVTYEMHLNQRKYVHIYQKKMIHFGKLWRGSVRIRQKDGLQVPY